VIPVRLEECEVPHRLAKVQRVDLFREADFLKLKGALDDRALTLGLTRQ
jgi:hypothetical protein